jgi:hypothetical protein
VGACAATGATSCTGGVVSDSCVPGTPAASDETCDAVDDDCDGAADEEYVPTATSCETQGCAATGTTVCVAGEVQDTCPTDPVCIAEIACADGFDNDGDAQTDCLDSDCWPEPECAPQPFSITVNGLANLHDAGHSTPTGGGILPPGLVLTVAPGATVQITSATGFVNQAGTSAPPDGLVGNWVSQSVNGIAGYTHDTRRRSLIGVFLTNAEPTNPAPPALHFPDAEFTELAPQIAQMFFVGDGLTSGGVTQRFHVPAGATRFFLGLTDACTGGAPGCFDDNSGSYMIQGQVGFGP